MNKSSSFTSDFADYQNIILIRIVYFIFFMVLFSNTIQQIFSIFSYVYLPITVTAVFFIIWIDLIKGKVNRRFIYIFILFLIILFYMFIFLPISIKDNFGIFLLGSMNIFLFPLFWLSIYVYSYSNIEICFNKISKILIFYGVIIAVGAIIQYYISPNLFGLIYNSVYSEDLTGSANIAKRAISFISSPQALSVFLAIILILTYHGVKNNIIKYFLSILICYSGFLTFSKSFILILTIYFFMVILIRKPLLILIIIVVLGVYYIPVILAVKMTVDNQSIARILDIPKILVNYQKYVTFKIWMSYLEYDTNIVQIIFGHGIGVVSRGAQELFEYSILNGSPESYIIQIYFEMGLVGLFGFVYIISRSFYNLYRIKEYRYLALLLVALLTNFLGTPALYGFTISLVSYSIIIFGFLLDGRKRLLRS